MADEKKAKKALEVSNTLCKMLDAKNFKYNKENNGDNIVLRFGVRGDDIPMRFVLIIDTERQLVRLLSSIPVQFSGDKILDGAMVTNHLNYRIADGSFDFNPRDGKVYFRMTTSFRESTISPELLDYMMGCACYTVDKYNDQLVAVSMGKMSVTEFIDRN